VLAVSSLYPGSSQLLQPTPSQYSENKALDTTTQQEHIRRAFAFWDELSAFYQTPALQSLAVAVENHVEERDPRSGARMSLPGLFGHMSSHPEGLVLLQHFFNSTQHSPHRDLLYRIFAKAEVITESSKLRGVLPLSYLSQLKSTEGAAAQVSSLNLEEFATWLRAALVMPSQSEEYLQYLLAPAQTFLDSLPQRETFRLLTYNVGSMPPWFSPWQPLRRITIPQIARALSGSADVILLQETWAPHMREALWCLLNKDYRILYGDRFPLFLGCSGLTTIVSKEHEVLESSLYPFRTTRGSERLVRKGGLHTSILWRGIEVDIQNIHAFSPKIGAAMTFPDIADKLLERSGRSESFVRNAQLHEIEQRMNQAAHQGTDLVIAAGDFNLLADRPRLHRSAVDLFKLRYPESPNSLEYQGNTWITGRQRTQGGAPFNCRLDRGYLLPPSLPLAVDVEVLYDWEWSDHFPVRLTLEVLKSRRFTEGALG
jgi:exonuclease III